MNSNIKRRSVSYSASANNHGRSPSFTGPPPDPFAIRGHASAFSFTNPAFLQETQSQQSHAGTPPRAPPAPRYNGPQAPTAEEAYPTFAQKMGYFRKLGSMSLTPPVSPMPQWRERANSIDWTWRDSREKRSSKLVFGAIALISTLAGLIYLFRAGPPVEMMRMIAPSSLPHYVACDPYSAFGSLQIDHIDPDGTRWQPFDKSCSPPRFFSQLRNGDLSDLDWLRNKTVVTLGDTVDREHVEQFCQLMGREAEVVRDVKDWTPNMKKKKSQPVRMTGHDAKEATMPRACYVPEADFLLISFFHYGLDEDNHWQKSPIYTAPGLFEDRIKSQVLPLMRSLAASGRSSAPDFVEVSSGAYDLMKWAEEDISVGKSTIDPATQDRTNWYRSRMEQVLRSVRRNFPKAKGKMWRSIHFPQDQPAELQYFKEQVGVPQKAKDLPAHFATSRVLQIDQIAKSVVVPATASPVAQARADPLLKSFRYNPWGTLMLGHEAHQADRLHGTPGAPGTALWADVMLSELHRAVLLTSQA